MIEKLWSRFLAEVGPITLNTLGMGVLFFVVIWAGLAGYRLFKRRTDRREVMAGALIVLVNITLAGGFLYLTASTPARRAYIDLPMYELGRGLINVVCGALLAAGASRGLYRLAQRVGARSGLRFGLTASAGIGLFMALISAVLYYYTFKPDLDEITTSAPSLAAITIADGLPIKVFENTIVRRPTALELGPHHELYVAGIEGQIWRMEDVNQDGAADHVIEFTNGLRQPEGLAWGEAGLYVTVLGQVLRLRDTNRDGVADETQVILDGLPGEEYAFHQPNGITFGADGRLYVGVGSTTDHRPETHPRAARILSMNPDGSDLKVYATGVRNPFRLIPAPGGGLFAVDNGSSGCVDTPRQIDDCSDKVDVPEEVNYIVEGKDYGFPTVFGIPPQDSESMPPVITFADHTAPTGLLIYDGDRFPDKYKGQLFVALWIPGEIYSVRLYRVDAEHFVGASRLFARGLPGPSALLMAPDGGLYVASFSSSTLYYIGQGEPGADQPSAALSASGAQSGQVLFEAHCASCHGLEAQGIAGLGQDLTASQFLADKTDDEIVAFIKVGRDAKDPLNTNGITMPPKGGVDSLTDEDLYAIVAYLGLLRK